MKSEISPAADGIVTLRDVVMSDLPEFHAHQSDPVASRTAEFRPRAWDEFLAHWTRILGDATVDKKTLLFNGEIAGNVVAYGQDGRRLVGYWVGRDFWGKGVASRAVAAFTSLVTQRPLHAFVASGNAASIRVLEKCGFVVDEKEIRGVDGVSERLMVLRRS